MPFSERGPQTVCEVCNGPIMERAALSRDPQHLADKMPPIKSDTGWLHAQFEDWRLQPHDAVPKEVTT